MRDPHGSWQLRDPDQVTAWRPADPARAIEGPLDLAFFTDQTLVLELADEQVACREEGGCLRQVFLGGTHQLEVGTRPGQVAPDCRLVFLRSDVPLSWRWREGSELVIDTGGGRSVRLPLRGVCSLRISDPARFYASVLQGLEHLDADRLLQVLETTVRSQLESRLQPLATGPWVDPLRAQVLLGDLGAGDLAEELADLGLECLYLAVFTPAIQDEPVGAPVAETTPVGSYDDVL